jgi:hypothetical protein
VTTPPAARGRAWVNAERHPWCDGKIRHTTWSFELGRRLSRCYDARNHPISLFAVRHIRYSSLRKCKFPTGRSFSSQ